MLNLNEVKAGNKIRFIVTEGDYNTFWHFSPLGEYEVYDLMKVYPNKFTSPTGKLIIWCDDIDIHHVKYLNLNEWELV